MIIEAYVVQYLLDEGVTAYGEVPKSTAGSFVTVERTAGGETEHIDHATLAIQSWSDTMLSAARLDETVRGLMADLITDTTVSSVSLNSSYNYTNPNTTKYRYQSVYDIVYYNDD